MTGGDAKMGKIVAARNMEERRLLVSGLGIGNSLTSSIVAVEGDNGFWRLVADRSCVGHFFFFFFWFVGLVIKGGHG